MLPPSKVGRRAAIRATWATRFQNPAWECRFVIGSLRDSPWASLIKFENSTYGDIIELEDFYPETADRANHIKMLSTYKYLVEQEKVTGRHYDFISKVDDDNWLNILPFYETWIEPRLPGGQYYKLDPWTVIGRPFVYGRPFAYTSGRMYTISWPIAKMLARKFAADPDRDYEESHLAEDMIPEYFLYTDNIAHEFLPMEVDQAWDIGLENIVKIDTILIHCIKDDERLVEMSSIFNDRGRWNGKLINGLTNFNRSMAEVVDRLGKPSDEQLKNLTAGWKKWDSTKPAYGDTNGDPKATLDFKMIREVINVEDRQKMGDIFPLNLPGNNESTTREPPEPL